MNSEQWARALKTAREFRVPTRLFAVHARQTFNFVELQHARYPFDEIYVPLEGDLFASDSGDFRFTGLLFRREGAVHAVYARAISQGAPLVFGSRMTFHARSHPRRHVVSEHVRRYHTKGGVIAKTLAPFDRGGKTSKGARYRIAGTSADELS